MRSGRYRRTVCTLLAAAVAFGLLHAPSMMMTGWAASPGTHCGAPNSSTPDSLHNHQASHELDAADTAAGKPGTVSDCPLANITAIAVHAPDVPLDVRALGMKAAEPPVLTAAPADLVDPPPRIIS